MNELDRFNFRKAAISYLRDSDVVIDPKVQARIADEIERLVKRITELETALDKIEAICKYGPDADD